MEWWERGSCSATVSSIIQMDAVPLHLFSLLGLNIKMEAPKEADDDHDPEDEAHAESKGWVCLTHCISTTAAAEPETLAVQLTVGRGKYSCHVWPKFHERQAEGIFLAPNMSPSKDVKWPFSSQLEYGETELWVLCSHTFKWILAILFWILPKCSIQYYQRVTTLILTPPVSSRVYCYII